MLKEILKMETHANIRALLGDPYQIVPKESLFLQQRVLIARKSRHSAENGYFDLDGFSIPMVPLVGNVPDARRDADRSWRSVRIERGTSRGGIVDMDAQAPLAGAVRRRPQPAE
jgi:hypothetical protein